MGRIRVLVVDDSRFMVSAISSILTKAGDIEVVGYALDGESALEQARLLKPDVITMDVVMPRVDGIEATRNICKQLQIPVLVLSAHTQQGTRMAIQALEAGAVDYVAKPSGELSMDLDKVSAVLVEKVRSVATGRRLRSAAADVAASATATGQFRSMTATTQLRAMGNVRARTAPPGIVVIGASAGGVPVLTHLLPRFEAWVPFPILVVQHFPEGFTTPFVERLAGLCQIPVREATAEMQLAPATIFVAPGGYNVEITPFSRLRLSQDTGPAVFRPSIDVAMKSVAQTHGPAAAAMILTGMGKDGAIGAKAISDAGGLVMVQDPASATAYGMPRAAVESGAAHVVLPPDQLFSTLLLIAKGTNAARF